MDDLLSDWAPFLVSSVEPSLLSTGGGYAASVRSGLRALLLRLADGTCRLRGPDGLLVFEKFACVGQIVLRDELYRRIDLFRHLFAFELFDHSLVGPEKSSDESSQLEREVLGRERA